MSDERTDAAPDPEETRAEQVAHAELADELRGLRAYEGITDEDDTAEDDTAEDAGARQSGPDGRA